ncbi:MAG: hypothetical protein NTY48_04570 [Candidatus Diapherotrites archaeon]|nr:hypothetical protein [Candidatus Diapherotrites archaeon]
MVEDAFWRDLEVAPKPVNTLLAKAPKTILKTLALNGFSKPLQDYLRAKAGAQSRGVDLVDYLKTDHKELLRTVLLLNSFAKKKNNRFVVSFAKKHLTRQQIQFSVRDTEYDRVVLVALLFDKNENLLKELYWAYQIQRRNFNEYTLMPSVAFYESLRGFPSEVITPGVRTNSNVDRAATILITATPDEKVSVAVGSKKPSLKLCTYFARLLDTNAKFCRIVNSNKKNVVKSFLTKFSAKGGEVKLIAITVTNVSSIVGQPTIQIKRNEGIQDSLKDLKNKGVDFSSDYLKVTSIEVQIDGKPLEIQFFYEDDKATLVCAHRFINDSIKRKLKKFLKEHKLKITFGSEKL